MRSVSFAVTTLHTAFRLNQHRNTGGHSQPKPWPVATNVPMELRGPIAGSAAAPAPAPVNNGTGPTMV